MQLIMRMRVQLVAGLLLFRGLRRRLVMYLLSLVVNMDAYFPPLTYHQCKGVDLVCASLVVSMYVRVPTISNK